MTKKANSKNLIIAGAAVVLIIVGLVLTKGKLPGMNKTVSPADAKTKAEAFIKDFLLSPETKFTVGEAKSFNAGLYEMEISIEGSDTPIKSYMTKDGKLFIPQAMDIAEVSGQKTDEAAKTDTAKEPVAEAPKSDKPVVELFVMSHCPYGTQIEKGILPVVQSLGSGIDFQLKFVDYAMHDKKELDEQMNQYCIMKEQGGKFLSYLNCFLKAGDGATCIKDNGIDAKKLSSCVAATDKQFKITEVYGKKDSWGSSFPPFPIYKADNEKYGVQGSPTLVINGEQVSAGRDASSLAKAICGAFNEGKAPEGCKDLSKFSSAQPTPGFGEGTTSGGATNAQCN